MKPLLLVAALLLLVAGVSRYTRDSRAAETAAAAWIVANPNYDPALGR